MKIQCDMCEKTEAGVYCTADEASLCDACDHRVHHANKLANKHPRFSLHHSSDQPPRCDICQDKRAFLFCKEDRAILCRECDTKIHRANEHTQCHNRFLLSGVRLSVSSSCYDNSSDQALCSSNSNGSSETDSRKSSIVSEDQNLNGVRQECQGDASMEASSISEYLMETLPGWHVEELLDPCASHPYGFHEGGTGTYTLPIMAHDSDNNGDLGCLWSEDLGILVNSGPAMDNYHQISSRTRTGSLSKRLFVNGFDSNEKMNKDRFSFNTSSIKRPRQAW